MKFQRCIKLFRVVQIGSDGPIAKTKKTAYQEFNNLNNKSKCTKFELLGPVGKSNFAYRMYRML